jgi:hypothetical protein
MKITANTKWTTQSEKGRIKKEQGTNMLTEPLGITNRKFEATAFVLDVVAENRIKALSVVHELFR